MNLLITREYLIELIKRARESLPEGADELRTIGYPMLASKLNNLLGYIEALENFNPEIKD